MSKGEGQNPQIATHTPVKSHHNHKGYKEASSLETEMPEQARSHRIWMCEIKLKYIMKIRREL